MAFPEVITRTKTRVPADSLTHPVAFQQVAGDLVLIWGGFSVPAQVLTNSQISNGFTLIQSASHHSYACWKILDGSEGGGMEVTMPVKAEKGAWIAWNIRGYDPAQPPEWATWVTGTSTTPAPGNCTPTGGAKDYLWIAGCWQTGEEDDDDTWATAPIGYGNLTQCSSGTDSFPASNCQVAAAEREWNAASEDPGVFTLTQSLFWEAVTIAIHPGTGGPPVDPPAGDAGGQDYIAWQVRRAANQRRRSRT